MPPKYELDNLAQVQKYFNNCLIRHKNIPIVVQNVMELYDRGEEKRVLLVNDVRNRGDKAPYLVVLDDPDVNLEPVKLGLMNNGNGGYVYVSRVPSRTWHIGLHSENIGCGWAGRDWNERDNGAFRVGHFIASTVMYDCINNGWSKQPWMNKIVHLRGGVAQVPHNRRFLLCSDWQVWDGKFGKHIGNIDAKSPRYTVKLKPEFQYLKELLVNMEMPIE